MKQIRCESCGSVEFEPILFNLKCKYCGSLYTLDLDFHEAVLEALKSQGFKVVEDEFSNSYKITHPSKDENEVVLFAVHPLDRIDYSEALSYFKL